MPNDSERRQQAFNIANNRVGNSDPIKAAQELYEFMGESEPAYQAVLSANNRVSGQATVADVIAQARSILEFINPTEKKPGKKQ